MRLNLIYYGEHNVETDSRIKNISPDYAIVNTPHGLWGEILGHGVCLCLQDISEYQVQGIKVIGYITSGYEGRGSGGSIGSEWYTLEENEKLIKKMYEIDGVDGVFIDECSAFPDKASKDYLKTLTGLANGLRLITWGNVGQDQFDPWFFKDGGFDIMHSTEDWRGQKLSQVQKEWGHRISVAGFKPRYTVQDAYRLTLDAWGKGLAYCYISSASYNEIAPWMEEYAALLRLKITM